MRHVSVSGFKFVGSKKGIVCECLIQYRMTFAGLALWNLVNMSGSRWLPGFGAYECCPWLPDYVVKYFSFFEMFRVQSIH
jgi:hypothetical protein